MIDKIVKDIGTETYNSLPEIQEKLHYYREVLNNGLYKLSEGELEGLKSDLHKFFNVHFTLFSDTYPTKLFRVTNNRHLLDGKKQKLQNITQLIGPPEECSYYGRCNLPGESVFYSALNFHTAIWETKPQEGDYITVSEWKIKDGQRLNTHNIFHPKLTNLNEDSNNAFLAWQEAQKQINPEWVLVFEELMIFLTEQFMKIVDSNERENYLVSALYSSKLIQAPPDGNGFKIDAVCYPSVKMEYGLTNLAIVNALALEKLDLVEITVYDVGETNYNEEDKQTKDLIKVSPMIIKTSDFDFVNDKINYDLQAELRLAIKLHEKYGR